MPKPPKADLNGAAVPVQARESAWSAGAAIPVLEKAYSRGSEGTLTRQYDISADGQRFLMIKDEPTPIDAAPSIIVVRPWFDELKRLVPTR